MTKEDKLILVGVISAAHGIKGNILIKSYTESEITITKLPLIDQNNLPIDLKFIRNHSKDGIICKIANCNDRNQAEDLKGTKLYCYRKDFPTPMTEEFYIEDLRGLKVINQSKKTIGIVLDVVNYGAGDIVEVKFNDGKCEMFPFTKEFFPSIEENYIVLSEPNLRIK